MHVRIDNKMRYDLKRLNTKALFLEYSQTYFRYFCIVAKGVDRNLSWGTIERPRAISSTNKPPSILWQVRGALCVNPGLTSRKRSLI